MADRNFKARIGVEAPLIQTPLIKAEDGATAITLTNATGDITTAGNITAGLDLTVNNAVKFNGSTSGQITLGAPSVAGSASYTLPSAAPAVTGYVLSGTTGGVMSWVANPDTNTTYTIDATSTTGGANLNLAGSDSSTDSVAYLGSGATTVTRTDANTITISSTDANTTYDFAAASTTGGANLNLTGSDATTDTVKLTNGGYITAAYTSATEVTLGSNATDANTASTIVARDGSGNFSASGATLGNISVGVSTDNTIVSTDTNGNITLAPNGTGSVINTFSNGGNLTSNRNMVVGAIRNSTSEGLGDIWALNATTPVGPVRGISIDNSVDTTRAAGLVVRTYNNTNTVRSRLVLERARFTGTVATPAAVQAGDLLGEVGIGGYSSTGWVNDTLPLVPAFFGFTAVENWVSNTNLGATFSLSLLPSATTATSSANNVAVITANPQGFGIRSDAFGIGQGKTSAFVATGCSTSGTTLTIGTLTSGTVAVGQLVQTSGNLFNAGTYIVSGSGSTWTLSSNPGTLSTQTVTGQTGYIGAPTTATTVDALNDLRLLKNVVKGSGGTTQITTSSAGATLALAGDTITLENAAGTDYAVLNSTSATFAQPVGLPVKTATQWNAITGAVGQMVCVSDSASGGNPNGMMAFWDTTNTRWSYIHDNTAV